MLSKRESAALDNYITGHYGEDQFKQQPRLSRLAAAGAKARRAGKPITSCRCRSEKNRKEWIYGWCDEDMAMMGP
jgi:ribosome modulation factor